ncbi:MAG: AAA family ATPase [Planctomycetota bacterium]
MTRETLHAGKADERTGGEHASDDSQQDRSHRQPKPAEQGAANSSLPTPPDPSLLQRLRDALNGALRGKPEVIELVVAALLGRGHLLIEDLPGLGKTTLAKALAAAIGGKFSRIQCTPDLLPSDITGFNIFNQQTRAMEFMPGPVFADVLLADEINRATPRTQSALLEVMAERQVTADTSTRRLPDHFFVIATQNPIELHGTFALPEAQLDRFAMKIRIGYPDRNHIVDLLGASIGQETGAVPMIEQVLTREELLSFQKAASLVAAELPVRQYVAQLGEAIREHPRVTLGISPRGQLIWLRLAQAWALLRGRSYVVPDDIQDLALPVLEVRLAASVDSYAELVREILDSVPAPVYPQKS